MNNKNFYIVTAILVIVTTLALISYLPTRFDAAAKTRVENFPMKIGEWTAKEIALSKLDYDILETTNLFVRDYTNSKGQTVNFYLIYSEDNRKVSHPPEVCYMGSGITITNRSTEPITDSIMANKLVIETADSESLVVYWYKAGKLHTDKYLKQQLKVVLDRTLGKRTSGALLRFSVNLKDGLDQRAALDLIKSFYSEIAPLVEKYLP